MPDVFEFEQIYVAPNVTEVIVTGLVAVLSSPSASSDVCELTVVFKGGASVVDVGSLHEYLAAMRGKHSDLADAAAALAHDLTVAVDYDAHVSLTNTDDDLRVTVNAAGRHPT